MFIAFHAQNKTMPLFCQKQTDETRFGLEYLKQKPKLTFKTWSFTTNAPYVSKVL